MEATAERRPFVKKRNDGSPYILVHRKGQGMRARQITPQGWLWVREKYPESDYPTAESIPLTYDDYWQLQGRRDIHTERRGSASRPQSRRPRNDVPTRELNNDTPEDPKPPTQEAATKGKEQSAGPIEVLVVKCGGCQGVAPVNAQFCPRCGHTLKSPPRKDANWGPVFWWCLSVAAVVVLVCWHPWRL